MADSSILENVFTLLRPILDSELKQGMLRLFQQGLFRLGTPVLDEENIAVLKQFY